MNEPGKKVAVIILGAGAPLMWGAPLTSRITDLICNDNQFKTKNNQEPLGEFIRRKLAEFHKRKIEDINFEQIVNAVEEIVGFLTDQITAGGPPEYTRSLPLWFQFTGLLDEMENFTFKPNGDGSDGYLFNHAAKDGGSLTTRDNFQRAYYYQVLDHYIQEISTVVKRYDRNLNDERWTKKNVSLMAFYNELRGKGYCIRFYTTNYDSLIPRILSLNQIEIFTGFDSIESDSFPNTKNILNDSHIDCHYNLHGSVYWDIALKKSDVTKWRNAFAYTTEGPILASRIALYTNPGQKSIIHNIVTGYSKLQKISIEPARSFFARFMHDCINADLAITIGYSFGDIHINRSIEHAVSDNQAGFIHVTLNDSIFSSLEYKKMQEYVTNKRNYQDFIQTDFGYYVKNPNAFIFTGGFEKFLMEKQWIHFFKTM